MKAGFVFLFALAMGACPLAAQYTHMPQYQGSYGVAGMEGMGGTHIVVTVATPAVNSCPVSMRAQHLSDGSMVKAGEAAHPAGIGQRLHLTLRNQGSRQIAGATLTIHGTTPKAHAILLASAQGGPSDTTQNMSVSFSRGPDGSVSADLWIPGMSAVQSIELDSLEYSDGSTWKLADGNACRIAPDPFMLISER